MANMELEGMDNLITRIEEMGKAGVKIENKALRKAAKIIVEEAKTNVKVKTGNLRDGLKVSGVRKKNGQKYILAGIQKGDNSRIFYGKFLEFGASPHLIKINKGRFKGATLHHPGVNQQPFMGPAYESKKEEAKEIIKQEIKNALGL